jgi:hypothetical protein
MIEQSHLPLLALPLHRDRREGKRNIRKNRRKKQMGREGDVRKNKAR